MYNWSHGLGCLPARCVSPALLPPFPTNRRPRLLLRACSSFFSSVKQGCCSQGAGISSRFHALARRQVAHLDGLVAQAGEVHLDPGFDQTHRLTHVLPAVHSNGGEDPPTFQVESDKLSLLETSPYDQLVPVGCEPCILEVVVVLIGPEPVDLFWLPSILRAAAWPCLIACCQCSARIRRSNTG